MKYFKKRDKGDVIDIIKQYLSLVLYVVIILEIIIFPSWANVVGCLMALICLIVFNLLFTRRVLTQFPFAFLMFMSMFMYRYLPLVATLIEGKPISYRLETPFNTFILETLSFIIGGLALNFSTKKTVNGFIQKKLFKVGFFETNSNVLWGMGFLGLLVRLYTFQNSDVEYGDMSGKFIEGLSYFLLAPICLLFPSLLNTKEYKHKKLVVIYIALVFLINIASNSRELIIAPILVYMILFFLNIVITKKRMSDFVSPLKLLFAILFLIFGLNFLSDLSMAMLANRDIRGDISKTELFQKTIDTYFDVEQMGKLRSLVNSKERSNSLEGYSSGWTESYLDNFMFNRYANILITDQTLFYADKSEYGNPKMLDDFYIKTLAVFPGPILKMFNVFLDKKKMEYSRGDYLYSLHSNTGLGGYRVTSHLADGLATFNYWYFPIQFILWYCVFTLLNTFVLYTRRGVLFSAFGLMNVFVFVGMFRNAQGSIGDLNFILRGYLQGVITYLIVLWILKIVINNSSSSIRYYAS